MTEKKSNKTIKHLTERKMVNLLYSY